MHNETAAGHASVQRSRFARAAAASIAAILALAWGAPLTKGATQEIAKSELSGTLGIEARMPMQGVGNASVDAVRSDPVLRIAQEFERPAPQRIPPPPPPDDVAEQPKITYPLNFTKQSQLAEFGVTITDFGARDEDVQHTDNKCYKTSVGPEGTNPSDGLYDVSVSGEMLAVYVARGFTLNSLCLAIQSGIRFDPESRRRLPTFHLIDPAIFDTGADGEIPSLGYVNELPLDVPNCFRNGHPYSDCAMKFEPMSGEPLSPAMTEKYRELGARIDADVTAEIAAGKLGEACESVVEKNEFGWLQMECRMKSYFGPSPEQGADWEHQSMLEISKSLPKGYGYSVYRPKSGGAEAPTEKPVQQSGWEWTASLLGIETKRVEETREEQEN